MFCQMAQKAGEGREERPERFDSRSTRYTFYKYILYVCMDPDSSDVVDQVWLIYPSRQSGLRKQ